MSKKNTWRIWASSGSIPSACTVDRWLDSGTVSLSSTLSALLTRESSSSSCSLRIGRTGAARVAMSGFSLSGGLIFLRGGRARQVPMG